MRRKALVIITLFIAMFLVVGCGKKDESSGSGDKTTITVAWWGSQARHDATVKVIEMYEKENPDINIEYEFYDFDGYFTKLNTLQASNTVWDVFQMGGNYQAYLTSIEPLNKFVDDGLIDVSDTTEQYLSTTTYKKDLLGISNGVGAYAIAYDPEIFKKAGLDEPTEAWTWEEFEAMCMTIHDKLGIYGFSNFDDFKPGASVGIAQYGDNLNFFDPATESKTLGFDDPELLVPYIEMRQRLVKEGAYPDTGAIAEIKDIEGDYLVTGEAAMTWLASNQITAVSEAAQREIKLVTLPRRKKDVAPISLASSQMMCVSTNSKVKEESAKFINYFENNIEANKILNAERGVPIMSKVRDTLTEGASDTTVELFNYVDLVGEIGNKDANNIESPYNAVIEDQYKLYMQDVVAGKMTPKDAATKIFEFAKEKTSE